MRTIRETEYTKIDCIDEKGNGGAYHKYNILNNLTTKKDLKPILTSVIFQNGPIQENGVNGCQNEDLLAIVIDRLNCFESGDFPSLYNAQASFLIKQALRKLEHRTMDRKKRGVEGKSIA